MPAKKKQGAIPIMYFVHSVRRAAAVLAMTALVAVSSQAVAQEISETHVKAARAAISAVRATDAYDNILPAAAIALKQNLIQQNPDLQEMIIQTVDEKTIEMARRRADLEREVALAYARIFTEEELNAIAGFYATPTGQKLLLQGPIVSREVAKAAEIWQRGISRDLTDVVGKALELEVSEQVKSEESAPAPQASPTDAPAEEAPADAPVLEGLEAPAQ